MGGEAVEPFFAQVGVFRLTVESAHRVGFPVQCQQSFGPDGANELLAGGQVLVIHRGQIRTYPKPTAYQTVGKDEIFTPVGLVNACFLRNGLQQPVAFKPGGLVGGQRLLLRETGQRQ